MTRRTLTALLGSLALFATTPGLAPAADTKEPPLRLLVPAYFYPSGDGLAAWKRLIASADKAPVVAIVNPDSGPGKSVDANYQGLFRLAKGSKATLIGYVTFSYGKRPASAVKADVDSWLYFYPEVQGIFFDEQPSGADMVPFVRDCVAYARGKFAKGPLITNPGTVCVRDYFDGPDNPSICLFEGDEKGFASHQPPDWTGRLGAERFVTLIYGVKDAASMRQRFREAVRKKTGYLYVTDATGPMPWGRLPSYWDDELAETARGGR